MDKHAPIVVELRDALRGDQSLSCMLAAPAETINVPFQKSTTDEFLAVSVLLKPTCVNRNSIDTAIERIVSICYHRVRGSKLWGIDVLVCGASDSGQQKILRVMVPQNCMAEFSSSRVPNENQNLTEAEPGCIWYSGRRLLGLDVEEIGSSPAP